MVCGSQAHVPLSYLLPLGGLSLEGYLPSGFPRPGPVGTNCFPAGAGGNGKISHLLSSSLLSAGVFAGP